MSRARRRQVRRAFRGGWDPVKHNLRIRIGWRAALFLDAANYISNAVDRYLIASHHAAIAKEMVASYHAEPAVDEIVIPLTRKDHQ
jgi:hypothetical protein